MLTHQNGSLPPSTSTPLAPPLQIGTLRIDPPVLQAPMAGYTNYAFRQIVREYGGVGLQATEMVSARSFVWRDQAGCEQPDRLWGVRDEPRPLAVQIWDNDPETLARVGARLANEYRRQRRRYQLRLSGATGDGTSRKRFVPAARPAANGENHRASRRRPVHRRR